MKNREWTIREKITPIPQIIIITTAKEEAYPDMFVSLNA